MIDLNIKPETKTEDDPIGKVIIVVLPFCAMLIWGVLHAL